MTGRVLVVDDIPANVKLLEARLSAEYFDVLTALLGAARRSSCCERERVDVVLLDVMMPGMDGFEVCRRIKSAPKTMHMPVVMVTALDQPADKVQGLEAGADDFLTKPVDDIALITRVKNLARLKIAQRRDAAAHGDRAPRSACCRAAWRRGRRRKARARAAGRGRSARRRGACAATLVGIPQVDVEPDPQAALQRLAAMRYDLLIVSLNLADADGLRLCSQVRALERTRHLPIIVLVQPGDEARLLRALDMGVNDYLTRPVDRNELLARVRTQIKRKRHADHLRGRLEESVELAVTDALTGLHNRRYMETHLGARRAGKGGRAAALAAVRRHRQLQVRSTMATATTSATTCCASSPSACAAIFAPSTSRARVGGEEFVVVMPDTGTERALHVGERLRECDRRRADPRQ